MRFLSRRAGSVAVIASMLSSMLVSPIVSAQGIPIPHASSVVPNRFIVLMKDGTSPDTVIKARGIKFSKKFNTSLKGFVATMTGDTLSLLKKDARVQLVEPDYVVTTQQFRGLDLRAFRFSLRIPYRTAFTFPFPWPFPTRSSSSSSSKSSSTSSVKSSSSSSSAISTSSSVQSSSSVSSSSLVSSSSSSLPASNSSSSLSSSSSLQSSISSVVSSSPSSSSSVSSIHSSVSSSSSTSPSTQVIPTGVARIEDLLSPTAQIGKALSVNTNVAIIDTGIQLTHPDLNVTHHINIITGCGLDSNGCGNDDNGHGTHVAGTVGALDNSIGVVGVAPGANLWAVKVLDSQGSGYMSDIISGINFVADHADQIGVANMSFGCVCQSAALDQAINTATAKGVVFVAAAGNSSQNASTFSPANNANVIAVSAIADSDGKAGGTGGAPSCRTSERDDKFASFSNYGSTVAIAAPGVCILSTWLNSGYNTISGTSMASPHVTGAVALYLATHAKPQNQSQVLAVKQALITAGIAQNSAKGFTGDPDSSHEPLLDVASF